MSHVNAEDRRPRRVEECCFRAVRGLSTAARGGLHRRNEVHRQGDEDVDEAGRNEPTRVQRPALVHEVRRQEVASDEDELREEVSHVNAEGRRPRRVEDSCF